MDRGTTCLCFTPLKRPSDSIIYVIDESVRGSNLSLNGYPRATTPFLQSLETRGLLRNLGICVAAGSFSHISNAYLLSGHNAFPDDAFRTDRNPTIFDYAKKMGYETVYIDINQAYLPKLMKAAGDGPVRSLDWWMDEQSFTERHIDLETAMDPGIARYLSSLLNERGGYFIVVNKKGLHFHYRYRYPDGPAFTIWSPVCRHRTLLTSARPDVRSSSIPMTTGSAFRWMNSSGCLFPKRRIRTMSFCTRQTMARLCLSMGNCIPI